MSKFVVVPWPMLSHRQPAPQRLLSRTMNTAASSCSFSNTTLHSQRQGWTLNTEVHDTHHCRCHHVGATHYVHYTYSASLQKQAHWDFTTRSEGDTILSQPHSAWRTHSPCANTTCAQHLSRLMHSSREFTSLTRVPQGFHKSSHDITPKMCWW